MATVIGKWNDKGAPSLDYDAESDHHDSDVSVRLRGLRQASDPAFAAGAPLLFMECRHTSLCEEGPLHSDQTGPA